MNFFRTPSPIWAFFDIDGHLAAGGEIYTYRSADKTELKDTFLDPAGLFPAPNPLTLNDLGQLAYDIYFSDDEKYYLEFYDSQGRELHPPIDNFPDVGSGGGGSVVGINSENELQNGQFRFLYELSYDTLDANPLDVAYFWQFQKSNISATDKITFNRFPLGDSTEGSPIYELNYICTSQGSGESFKDFYQTMEDVRTFEQATLTFSQQIYSDSPKTVEIIFRQFFGTGGTPSSTVDTAVTTFNLTGGIREKKYVTFTVPSVSGKTLGTNNDDYIAIIIRMPLDSTCNIKFTNCFLSYSNMSLPYPRITKEKEDSYILGALIPEIGDDDYGKAITVDSTSTRYDLIFPIPVGAVIPYFGSDTPNGFVLPDGSTLTTYESKNKYQRLFNVLQHIGGYGYDGFYAANNQAKLSIFHTKPGFITNAAAGTSGFTVSIRLAGSATNYFKCSIFQFSDGSTGYIENPAKGAVKGSAGFTPGIVKNADTWHTQKYLMSQPAGSAISPGLTMAISSTTTDLAPWFRVGGAGTPTPLSGYTAVPIDITTTDIAQEVLMMALAVLGGHQVTNVTCLAASAITTGAYFLINTSVDAYYIWYSKDGIGTDPKISGKIGLQVDVKSSDTAIQVAQKTATILINAKFMLPNIMGKFMRFGLGNDDSDQTDGRLGNNIGSVQFDQYYQHLHGSSGSTQYLYSDGSSPTGLSSGADLKFRAGQITTTLSGGTETRPINIMLKPIMKY